MTRIALVQFDAAGERDDVRRRALRLVGRAADQGADLIVLPEYAAGWAPVLSKDLAEPLDGPFVSEVRESARARHVTVVTGVVVPGAGERSVNLAVAVGPDGAVLASYAKVHLFDAFGTRESDALEPGDPAAPPLTFTVDRIRFGVLTCYDIRFPEVARRLLDAGVHAILVIAAWAAGPGKEEQLRVLARARALENTSYLALACQHGAGRAGRTAVVDPWGQVLAEAPDDGEHVLVTDLRLPVVERARERVPVLAHRRYAVVPRAEAAD